MRDEHMKEAQEEAAKITDAAMEYAAQRVGINLNDAAQPHMRAEVYALATVYAQTATALFASRTSK